MGAFSAEIFRGGIMSIDKGQWQAARAIGMLPRQVMSRIILPQATSLLAIVAVPDLMYTAQILVSETFRPLEIYTCLAIIYFVILYPLQKLAKKLENRDDL